MTSYKDLAHDIHIHISRIIVQGVCAERVKPTEALCFGDFFKSLGRVIGAYRCVNKEFS